MKKRWRSLTAFAAAAWALYVAVRFYAGAPFPILSVPRIVFGGAGLPALSSLLQYAVSLALFVLVAFAAFGLGGAALRSWMKDRSSDLEAAAASLGLGYGILAYGTLALGAAGWLSPRVIQAAMVILGGGGLLYGLRFGGFRILRGALGEIRQAAGADRASRIFGVLILLLVATDVVMAFVPEIFYDALVYHLAVPRLYLLEGRIVPVDTFLASFPMTIQMLYLIGLALQGDSLTKLIHVSLMVIAFGALLALARRAGRASAGIIMVLCFVSIPVMQMNVWTSGIDAGLCAFAALSVFYLMRLTGPGPDDARAAILFGLFSGLLVGSKYTAAFFVAGAVLCLLVVAPRRWRLALLSMAVASAVVLPWLIKNAIETGNPVYPFLSDWLSPGKIDASKIERLVAGNRGFTPGSLVDVVRLFWVLSVEERGSMSFLGPLFLSTAGFWGAGLWKIRREPLTVGLALCAALVLGVGLCFTRMTRFLIPQLTVLSALAGLGLAAAVEGSRRWVRAAALTAVAAGFFLQGSWAFLKIHQAFTPQDVLLGRVTAADYLMSEQRRMKPNSSYPMYDFMKAQLSPSDRVLLVGEEKAYPLGVRYRYSGVFDESPLVRACDGARGGGEAAAALRAGGITHLMVNAEEARRLAGYQVFNWTRAGFENFQELWARHLEPVEQIEVRAADGYRNTLYLFSVSEKPLEGGARNGVPNILADLWKEGGKE